MTGDFLLAILAALSDVEVEWEHSGHTGTRSSLSGDVLGDKSPCDGSMSINCNNWIGNFARSKELVSILRSCVELDAGVAVEVEIL